MLEASWGVIQRVCVLLLPRVPSKDAPAPPIRALAWPVRTPPTPRPAPTPSQESVEQLVEMGFTELRAQKALVKTSNAGVEPAINWLAEHLEDADIDEPMDVTTKTQEELGEEAAKAMAGGGTPLRAVPGGLAPLRGARSRLHR